MRLRHSSLALLRLLSLTVLSPVQAQVIAPPQLVNFQGRLAKPDGTPVPDGNYSIRFSLWTAVTGGTEKWNQTLATVVVRNGTFAALLNTSTGAADKFNGDLWLEIKIGTDVPLTPRQQMVSVPFAMKANTVPDGSLTAEKFASGALGNLSWLLAGNNITDPATQFLGTTSNQPLVFRTNNTEKMRLLQNGNLGIGTSSPGAVLHVKGGLNNVAVFVGDLNPFGFSPFETNLSTATTHAWFAENGNRVFSIAGGGKGYFAGNLGIGVTEPATKLDVAGTVQMTAFKLPNGAAAGRVLTSDAAGVGTWQVATAPGWNLTGNAGTNPSTQFLGTTDAQPLVFRTSNTEKLRLLANGNVGIGTATPGVKLDVAGEIRGTVVTITGGSDVAEPYEVANAGDVKAIPGYVVAIDPNHVGQMRVAASAYDTTVAGIVSGANGINPGITLRQKGTVADGSLPVASIGRVWCWCNADANGEIKAGDLLTTSDTPGHAMKAVDKERRDGAVIGKAMSSLKSGKGLVLVLVSLK